MTTPFEKYINQVIYLAKYMAHEHVFPVNIYWDNVTGDANLMFVNSVPGKESKHKWDLYATVFPDKTVVKNQSTIPVIDAKWNKKKGHMAMPILEYWCPKTKKYVVIDQ